MAKRLMAINPNVNKGLAAQVFATTMRRMLAEPSPYDHAISATEAIAQKVIRIACDPENQNLYAIEMLMDRVDGKPAQRVSVEQAIEVLLNVDDKELSKALGIPLHMLTTQRRALIAANEIEDAEPIQEDNG